MGNPDRIPTSSSRPIAMACSTACCMKSPHVFCWYVEMVMCVEWFSECAEKGMRMNENASPGTPKNSYRNIIAQQQ